MEPGSYETDTTGMARAYSTIEEALAAAPRYVSDASEPHRTAAVASFYENILEYLHVHHGAEDELLYPRLEERCADDLDAIKRVGSQHRLLQEPMEAASDATDRWRTDPTGASTTELCGALSRVSSVLTSHNRDEE